MHRKSSHCSPVSGLFVLCLLVASIATAAGWPQFRGSARAGVGSEEDLLSVWSEDQPTVVWHQSIGTGYSAVTVVGDRLYTMSADDSHEYVLCLDASMGKAIWKVEAGHFVKAELGDGGPRSTPTVNGGVIYTVTSQARFLALDAKNGSVLWDKDLAELGKVPRFGYSVSPLVDEGVVIVEVGDAEKSPGIVALDKNSGETKWSSLEGPAGYSSAIVAEVDGVRQYVMFRRAGQEVVALSTAGEVLWRLPTPDALATIVMPIFVAPDRFFVSTSDDSFGGHMIRIMHEGGEFSAKEVWSERLMRNHFNTSVLVDGYLYGFDNGTLRCFNAESGERCWAKRGFGKGSVVAADNLLFVLSDAGLVALVRASPEGYEEMGRMQAMEGRSWTAPSIANGRLYVRDFDEIVSLDIRGDAGAAVREETP